jgi:hypothetical protein
MMGDRPGSLPGYTQVRTKMCRKDYGWYVGLVYDLRGLSGPMWLGCYSYDLRGASRSNDCQT